MGSMTCLMPKLSMSPNSFFSLVIELIERLKTHTSVKSTGGEKT
jgi:hypothetical protein